MELLYDTRGNDKQKQAVRYWVDNTTEEILYGGAKYGGKSNLGCNLIFGDAMIYPNTNYFIARHTLQDLRKYTTASIHEAYEYWGLDHKDYIAYNGKDNLFEMYNGSKVFFLECKFQPGDKDYHRFGSIQMTRGWCEEIGQIHTKAITNLGLTVGRWKNKEYGITKKLLMTCNPNKGLAYKKFYLPHKKGELEQKKKYIQALPQDNKAGDQDYIQSIINHEDKNIRERLGKGNWEYDDNPNALCDYEKILAIFDNNHIQGITKYITADIARLGSDKAIIGVWEGWRLIEYYSFDKSLTTEIQDAILALRVKHQIPKENCIADEDGVGGGVVDNTGIKGFVNNSTPCPENIGTGDIEDDYHKEDPDKPNYYNLQTQCAYKLAKRINTNGFYFKADLGEKSKEEIIEELEHLESYKTDEDRKLRIKPKALVKEDIGRSPDWRDLFLMREYFDLPWPKTPDPVQLIW